MKSQVFLQRNSAGLCPHGLPQSSCPICSNKINGGMPVGAMSKQGGKTSNQWSYQKCYQEWLDIKSFRLHRELNKSFFEKQFQNSLLLNSKRGQNIFRTPVIQIPARFIMNLPITAPVRLYGQKFFNMIFQAGEKLVNILGEIKNFTARKIIENLKKRAKKFISFCFSVIEDENYRDDETLAVFSSRERRKFRFWKNFFIL